MRVKLDFVTNSSSASYIVFDSRDVPDRKVMKVETTIDFMENVNVTFEDVNIFIERYIKIKEPDSPWRHYRDIENQGKDLSEKEYLAIIDALLKGETVHFYWEDLNEPISQFFTGSDIKYKFYDGP